ncbi:hypothetical protein Baya_2759 [Bagarius yarrelli]|uniref:Uncharacterized protein n=1 Tax=Bagarius yarrelli TaxID=175774 RepID=A0A556TQH7_BAGYA|nr:hypothetical protein Baya_2759 [Bagarius yarrelli]
MKAVRIVAGLKWRDKKSHCGTLEREAGASRGRRTRIKRIRGERGWRRELTDADARRREGVCGGCRGEGEAEAAVAAVVIIKTKWFTAAWDIWSKKYMRVFH